MVGWLIVGASAEQVRRGVRVVFGGKAVAWGAQPSGIGTRLKIRHTCNAPQTSPIQQRTHTQLVNLCHTCRKSMTPM